MDADLMDFPAPVDALSSPRLDPDVSIVVPVYRGAHSIGRLRDRLAAAFDAAGLSHEVIFVEDCGGDDSWEIMQVMAVTYPNVRAVKLSRNFGQHAATLCGISRARGRWVATIDDDLEQPPESLPGLVRKAQEGYAVVYGVNEARSHARWRNITSELGRAMFKFAIPSLNRDYTSMRVIDSTIATELRRFQSPFTFIDGYLSWLTNNYATVVVPHNQRGHGESNYSLRKLVAHMIHIFVTFSDLPLRIATWLGIGASLGGAAWGLAILVGRLLGVVTGGGYASLMAGITFIGGVQLLILGIFGEYLGRINFKTAAMPVFLVEKEQGA
ncbi:MAG TPA: glycosyltransferase family 2 protein [Lysobacter sp.]